MKSSSRIDSRKNNALSHATLQQPLHSARGNQPAQSLADVQFGAQNMYSNNNQSVVPFASTGSLLPVNLSGEDTAKPSQKLGLDFGKMSS